MPRIGKTLPLRQNRDFLRLYRSRTTLASPTVVVYAKRNRLGYSRLGITSSKKIGGAVQRNRARRVIRAAYAGLEPLLTPGWDIVLVARTKTVYVKSTEVAGALKGCFEKLKMLPAPETDSEQS